MMAIHFQKTFSIQHHPAVRAYIIHILPISMEVIDALSICWLLYCVLLFLHVALRSPTRDGERLGAPGARHLIATTGMGCAGLRAILRAGATDPIRWDTAVHARTYHNLEHRRRQGFQFHSLVQN